MGWICKHEDLTRLCLKISPIIGEEGWMADIKETPTSSVRRDSRWWAPPHSMPSENFHVTAHAARARLLDTCPSLRLSFKISFVLHVCCPFPRMKVACPYNPYRMHFIFKVQNLIYMFTSIEYISN